MAAASKTISCPNCGGSTELKAAGYTVSLVCQYCSSVLDVASPDVQVITAYNEAAQQLEIPLGTRGTLNGTEWEVIGYMRRSDSEMGWEEYLLFNPYAGYRWLSCVSDEWSLGYALTVAAKQDSPNSVSLDGESYTQRYAPETVSVTYVLGEFYWRVAVGEQVEAVEFYGPARSLSLETSGSEINWTRNDRIASATIASAFALPEVEDAASDERLAEAAKPSSLLRMFAIGGIASFILLILTIIFGLQGPSARQQFSVTTERAAKTVPIATITITRPYQAVTLTAASSQLDNQWVDLDYSLVNRETQQSVDAYGLIEYYRGYDSDGSWSEGSRTTTTKIASVPRGTYDVMVDAEAHNWTGGNYGSSASDLTVDVTVASGGAFMSNVILFMLFIFGPAFYALYSKIKNSAGSYSDYSGGYDGDDDD